MTSCDVITPPSIEYHMKEEIIVDVHNEDNTFEEKNTNTVLVSDVLPEQKLSDLNIHREENITTENNLSLKDYTLDFLSDYGPNPLWKKHCKTLECMMEPPTAEEFSAELKNPMCWNKHEVCAYISRLPKCRSHANIFLELEIDGLVLLSMTQDDLSSILKLRMGPSMKIINQIVCLRDRASKMVRGK